MATGGGVEESNPVVEFRDGSHSSTYHSGGTLTDSGHTNASTGVSTSLQYSYDQLSEEDNKKFPNRPLISAFRQQRLRAWQPILSADTVLPAFAIIGIICIPIGAVLIHYSGQVQEIAIDYTNCLKKGTTQDLSCEDLHEIDCLCELPLYLDKNYRKNMFVYYSLKNFYQNHRRYGISVDYYQLRGHPTEASNACVPYVNEENTGKPYAPCGVMANSMFNDEISLLYLDGKNMSIPVTLSATDIAWPTDKIIFKNPEDLSEFNRTAKPPLWTKPIQQLENKFENERLKVWMRAAAFSSFRKLYGKVQHTGIFQDGLPKGNYLIRINYNFKVTGFNGRKEIVLTNTTWIGGKNIFLGVLYVVVGSVVLVMTSVFFVIHKKFGKAGANLLKFNNNTPFDCIDH